jgi:hypothetical protein
MLHDFRIGSERGSRGPLLEDWVCHDPERWLSEFNRYGNGTDRPDMARIRAMRVLIQNQTLAVCRLSRFHVPAPTSNAGVRALRGGGGGGSSGREPGSRAAAAPLPVPEGVPPSPAPLHVAGQVPGQTVGVVQLGPTPRRRTMLCRASPEVRAAAAAAAVAPAGAAPAAAAAAAPFATVRSADCLEQAHAMCAAMREADAGAAGGWRVAVLNMANQYTPGGGFRSGCGAQEENLHRRSDLCCFLEDTRAWVPPPGTSGDFAFYPIPDDAVLYSPGVRVFRGPESQGYPMLRQPFSVDGEWPCPPGPW